jgi:hypothetical protein
MLVEQPQRGEDIVDYRSREHMSVHEASNRERWTKGGARSLRMHTPVDNPHYD